MFFFAWNGRLYHVAPHVWEELAKLVECLNKAFTAYGMEISAEKTKLMTNNTGVINTEIKVNGQKLETVTSFQFLAQL